MTIKTIDKAAATRISDEIFVALADLPEKLGVDIRPGGGSYSDGNLTLKIIIATRNGDGTVNGDDFEALLASYDEMVPYDLNSDGALDERDLDVKRGLITAGYKNVHTEADARKAAANFEKGEIFNTTTRG